jgi:hypothetical protein
MTTKYIGGPLDGQEATRTGTQWSIYRDDEGNPIPTPKGDREHLKPGRLPQRFYARQTRGNGVCYVYGPILRQWAASSHHPHNTP